MEDISAHGKDQWWNVSMKLFQIFFVSTTTTTSAAADDASVEAFVRDQTSVKATFSGIFLVRFPSKWTNDQRLPLFQDRFFSNPQVSL